MNFLFFFYSLEFNLKLGIDGTLNTISYKDQQVEIKRVNVPNYHVEKPCRFIHGFHLEIFSRDYAISFVSRDQTTRSDSILFNPLTATPISGWLKSVSSGSMGKKKVLKHECPTGVLSIIARNAVLSDHIANLRLIFSRAFFLGRASIGKYFRNAYSLTQLLIIASNNLGFIILSVDVFFFRFN